MKVIHLLLVLGLAAASCSDETDANGELDELAADLGQVGFEDVQWLSAIDSVGLSISFHDQVNSCMRQMGFDQIVPASFIETFVRLDFSEFTGVPIERRPPSAAGYEMESVEAIVEEGFLSDDDAETTAAAELSSDPVFMQSLLGFDPEVGMDPEDDPLVDAEGCLWSSLSEVLTDELGFESAADLAVMEQVFELRVSLWAEFDATWSSCMACSGHTYLSVSDPYFEFSLEALSNTELAVAEADLTCRRDTLSSANYQTFENRILDEVSGLAVGRS